MPKIMQMTRSQTAVLRWCSLSLVAGWLAACSTTPPLPGSYVVLLPDPDGKVGQVVVDGTAGQQRLTQPGQAAGTNGTAVSAIVSSETLMATFGEAMAARPQLPERFVIYFEAGGTTLTAESEQALNDVLTRVQARQQREPVVVEVTGHADTVGQAAINDQLSLSRAQWVAERLGAVGLKGVDVNVSSHGEANLLVPTPDETPEPRNRRVEITLR